MVCVSADSVAREILGRGSNANRNDPNNLPGALLLRSQRSQGLFRDSRAQSEQPCSGCCAGTIPTSRRAAQKNCWIFFFTYAFLLILGQIPVLKHYLASKLN